MLGSLTIEIENVLHRRLVKNNYSTRKEMKRKGGQKKSDIWNNNFPPQSEINIDDLLKLFAFQNQLFP